MRKRALVISAIVLATGALPATASAAGFGLGSLYGCNANGERNTAGAVIGGLVGGLAGSQISKNERALGAVAGAAIGAAVGNNIGCRMDRQAAGRAQDAFQRALDTGRAQSWSDEASGASGRIEVLDGGRPNAAPGPGRAETYEAIGRANVRAAPNVNSAVVDRLRAGEAVRTRQAVNGWLPVVEEGAVVGYVSSSAVRPAGGYGGGDCRVVQETVSTRGYAPETQRYNACRDDRGEWRLTAI